MHGVQLGNIDDILAQFIKLIVGLRLPNATPKNDDALDVTVFPPFLMKVNMASFINNIIFLRRKYLKKNPYFEGIVIFLYVDSAVFCLVLYGGFIFWFGLI
ncbi:MAG: hypothetical protein ACREAS_08575, partial [Nitrososphaera sp.]